MLTREVMGVFALGVLWLNTLLVVLAALGRARDLLARRAAMKLLDDKDPTGYGVLTGRIETAGAEPPAELAIEQVGRHAAGAKRAIIWHDRSHASSIRGGALVVGDAKLPVEAASELSAEVWLEPTAVVAAARCESDAAFDATYPAAKKARGSARTVRATIETGVKVWLVGEARPTDDGVILGPGAAGPLVIATFDPRAWLASRATWLVLFAPIAIALCAGCTAVALWEPVFDSPVSKVGGLLCFVYFLLVLPAGTRMRDATALPSVRALRGRWDAPPGRVGVTPS